MFVLFTSYSFAQTTVAKQNVIIDTAVVYGLTNPLVNDSCPMTYYESEIDEKGAAFRFDYFNQGGSGFDGYPSGKIGSIKAGGKYSVGNPALCGMPVQIKDLDYDLRINWSTIRLNAADSDDKWWATINVIFDEDDADQEPDPSKRDFDLVIQHVSYLQDDFSDLPNTNNGRYWYFARDGQGNLKPFTLYLDGVEYQWAVRYKFFSYPSGNSNAHKNDKVHIKFIPIDNANPIPFFDHPLKDFIDCTKNYLQYISLTPSELSLANEKLAKDDLWIKQLAAGFEVYTGNYTLGNEFFFVNLDQASPQRILDLLLSRSKNGNLLSWPLSLDKGFDQFKVYRSENNGAFELVAEGIRENSYLDTDVLENSTYAYYVTQVDRSRNESDPSDTVSGTSTGLNGYDDVSNGVKCYPNPFTNSVTLELPKQSEAGLEVFDLLGKKQTDAISVSRQAGKLILNFENLPPASYIILGENFSKLIHKL
mgnify:CR=1 FL=1